MTKKHFEAIAAIFRNTYIDDDTDPVVAQKDMADRMADLFKSENPQFDREKFLTACGL